MKIRGSHLVALAILAGIGGWMYTGKLIIGGQVDPSKPTIAEREASRANAAFRVRVETVNPAQREKNLLVRGRTKADAVISVRAETGGTVEQRAVHKGQLVQPGDLLCTIDQGIRATNLKQAQTQMAQVQADYNSTEKLVRRGFATKSKLRVQRTAVNAAKSTLAAAKQDMGRTEIRATIGGIVQPPMAEIGDNLSAGGICVTLLDADPMLFIGQISERDIGDVSIGMAANISLISGEEVSGKIRYISPVADAKTRTFGVEIELPNKQAKLRDGLTASAKIPLPATAAYQVDSSWLVLDDNGNVGVRTVGADNKVFFQPVSILGQSEGKLWVKGLKPKTVVITLGQNFVSAGETVQPVTAEQMKAAKKTASASIGDAMAKETK